MVFTGLLISAYLQKKILASLWLGLLLFMATLYVLPFMLGYAGWYARDGYRELLFYMTLQQLFLIPPLLYFYTKSLLDKSFRFTRKDSWHFLPAFLYLLYSLVVFVADACILPEVFFYRDGKDKDFDTWYQVAGFISLFIYILMSLATYRKYKRVIYQVTSFADTILFRWAQLFLLSLVALLLLRLAFFIVNPEWGKFGQKFWYYLSFSGLFYIIAIKGYTNTVQAPVIQLNEAEVSGTAGETLLQTEDNSMEQDAFTEEHGEAAIPDEACKAKIEESMKLHTLYENPLLTIQQLAVQINYPAKKVSSTINLAFHMNFNDYVNSHRTKAVITRLQSGEHNLQTLLGIAYDCGFNSKSTFNRSFKKHTGMTPRQYLENLQKT